MQDYQLFMRAVWGGESVFNTPNDLRVQNLGQALDYLRENYLAHGYKVLTVDSLGGVDVSPELGVNSPKAQMFAWHLVKDLGEKPVKENKSVT